MSSILKLANEDAILMVDGTAFHKTGAAFNATGSSSLSSGSQANIVAGHCIVILQSSSSFLSFSEPRHAEKTYLIRNMLQDDDDAA